MKNFKGFGLLRRLRFPSKPRLNPAHFAAVFLTLALSTTASARDLQGRLGLGYNAQFANVRDSDNGVPGIALKYAFTKDIGAEGVLGFSTGKPTNSVIGVKLFKNLFFETNLNFYYFVAGGIVHANSRSGADFQTGLGTEFFIPGIESVGLSFEAGAELTNLAGSFAFRTLGLSFLHAGMRFYF